MDNIRY